MEETIPTKQEDLFKAGTLVKFIFAFWYKEVPNTIDNFGVITKVFNNLNGNEHSIIALDDGIETIERCQDSIEFVESNRFDLISPAKERYEILKEAHSDLKWIKENWEVKSYSLFNPYDSCSILTLFNEIGWNANPNNEHSECYKLYGLQDDWKTLKPIFNNLMHDNLFEALNQADKIFANEKKDMYKKNIEKFYNSKLSKLPKLYEKKDVIA